MTGASDWLDWLDLRAALCICPILTAVGMADDDAIQATCSGHAHEVLALLARDEQR